MSFAIAKQEFEARLMDKPATRERLATQCPCCDSLEMQNATGFGLESLSTCGQCETIYDIKNLQEDSSIYSQTYFMASDAPQSGYFNYEQDRAGNVLNFRTRFEVVEKLVAQKGAFLDVGCALGHALDVAAERGWKVIFGIDTSEYCVRQVQARGFDASCESMVELAKKTQAVSGLLHHLKKPQKGTVQNFIHSTITCFNGVLSLCSNCS